MTALDIETNRVLYTIFLAHHNHKTPPPLHPLTQKKIKFQLKELNIQYPQSQTPHSSIIILFFCIFLLLPFLPFTLPFLPFQTQRTCQTQHIFSFSIYLKRRDSKFSNLYSILFYSSFFSPPTPHTQFKVANNIFPMI